MFSPIENDKLVSFNGLHIVLLLLNRSLGSGLVGN